MRSPARLLERAKPALAQTWLVRRLSRDTRGLARDTGLLSVGTAATTASLSIQVALISHILGLRAFGVFSLAVAYVTVIEQFFDMSPARAAIAFGARYLNTNVRAVAGVFQFAYLIDGVAGLVGYVVVAASAPLLAPQLVGPQGVALCLLYGLTLIASTVDDTSTSLLRVLDRFGLIAGYMCIREVARIALVTAALLIFHDLIALMVALVIHDVLAAGTIVTLSSRIFSRWTQGKVKMRNRALNHAREVRRPMLVMVFHMNLITYGRMLQAQGPTLLLGALTDPVEVGIFKVAMAVAAAVGTMYLPAWSAVLPRLAQLWTRRDIVAIDWLIRQGTLIALALMGTVGAITVLLRDPLLTAFGGSAATAGGATLAIGVLSQVINGATFWNDSLLYAQARAGLVTAIYLPSVAVMIPLLVILAPPWGAVGAAVSLLACTILRNSGLCVAAIRILRREARRQAASGPASAPKAPAPPATPGDREPLVGIAPLGLSERNDVLIHALAQLPGSVRLALPGSGPAAPLLDRLATAYGIRERVMIGPEANGVAGISVAPPSMYRRTELAEFIARFDGSDEPTPSRRGDDELFRGKRVVIVTNLPTHYRVPLFNLISERLGSVGGSLHVLFTAADSGVKPWMRPAPLEFDHTYLHSRRVPVGANDAPVNLERVLARLDPSVVLVGGFSPLVAGRVALHARSRQLPFGIWSGEIATRETADSKLRRRQRLWIVRQASFGIAYGFAAAEYFRQLAPELPLVIGRNTTPVKSTQNGDRNGATVEFLTVGRAIALKRIDVVVDAFASLSELPCRLTVAGDGPELPSLRARAAARANVRFLGAVPSDAISAAYSHADAFLFPSRSDVFGLALVEAMASGLPTVVSAATGAITDLAVPGRNCMVLDDHDPSSWAHAIRTLVEGRSERLAMGREAARTIAHRWTIDHAADAMIAGLRLGVMASASGL